jgi:hypothetical protein
VLHPAAGAECLYRRIAVTWEQAQLLHIDSTATSATSAQDGWGESYQPVGWEDQAEEEEQEQQEQEQQEQEQEEQRGQQEHQQQLALQSPVAPDMQGDAQGEDGLLCSRNISTRR